MSLLEVAAALFVTVWVLALISFISCAVAAGRADAWADERDSSRDSWRIGR